MSNCPYQQICGGCPLRYMDTESYRKSKIETFNQILAHIHQKNVTTDQPIFIADGNRRRAEMTFSYKKGKLIFGFNAAQSHEIADIEKCLSLTENLNNILPDVRIFLTDFCRIKTTSKIKNKLQTSSITQGDIWLIEAANGVDILLEISTNISLEHRLLISDFMQNSVSSIRFSVKVQNGKPETIVEKAKPVVNINGLNVFIPAGTFLQPSSAGQQALVDSVMRYIGNSSGKIADLFCGIGTFSYPLAQNIKNKITSADSAPDLLDSFQKTINALTLPNIKIVQKNLFKYPFDSEELKEFDIILFDPPRAGASSQVAQIAAMNSADKPQKVIAISCNPHTFINDANALIAGGYKLQSITMTDQFVYTNHFELTALFEKN